MKFRTAKFLLAWTVALASLGQMPNRAQASGKSASKTVVFTADSYHDVSAPLTSFTPKHSATAALTSPKIFPLHKLPRPAGKAAQVSAAQSAVKTKTLSSQVATTGIVDVEGMGLGFVGPQGTFNMLGSPPDTNGAVGDTQYVQAVNLSYTVFDKATGGTLLGPIPLGAIWTGIPGCDSTDSSDPIVLFDKTAHRWLISQMGGVFSGPPFYECVAISLTTDARGSYNRYRFSYTALNDYPKFGIWPDAYYVTYNMYQSLTSQSSMGPLVCALDRTSMLNGLPASQQCVLGDPSAFSLLPADVDGSVPPPSGAPNFLLSLDPNNTSVLDFWKFHVDWTTPANTVLTGPTPIAITPYSPVNGVPEPGFAVPLDDLSDRLMSRLTYRKFGDHESLVANHTVNTPSGVAGVRWYELRNPSQGTPTVYQQATFQPDSTHRWMASAAMDKSGDLAIGYSMSSASLFPSIGYTGRRPTDPLNTLETEKVLKAGSGSQQITPENRWGDYSGMSIDPNDDCTFWYTNEYLPQTGSDNWHTRINSFRFPNCGSTGGPPTANNQNVSTAFNTPRPIILTGSDPNGLLLTYILVTLPTHGTLSGSGANVTYTPNTGYTEPDSFTFKVNNGTADSNVARVTITISPPGAPVITSPGSATGTVGVAFNYQITATNNPTSYDATGLTPGVFINMATGRISGSPTMAGTSIVTIRAKNAAGTGMLYLSLAINSTPPSPTVAILSPMNDAILSNSVSIAGTASSSVNISWVGIDVDGITWGLATGGASWNYLFDTWFVDNGTHTLTALANDAAGSGGFDSISINVNNLGAATYNSLYKTPACLTLNSVCGSGSLLNEVGGREWHTPNTLYSSCPDGNAFSVSPNSIERFKISTLDGSTFAPGKTVKIETTVSDSLNKLDLYYTADVNNPTWVYITTLSGTGSKTTLSTTYVLPSGSIQAIRGNFRYQGTADPCTLGDYNDHDDLVFAVGGGGPTQPTITSASTAQGTVGVAFNYQITATNNPTSFNATGLPAGLSVNTVSGLISGTPTTAGTSNVTLSATNAAGTGNLTLNLTINSVPPNLTISLPIAITTTFGMQEIDAYATSQSGIDHIDYFVDGQPQLSTSNYPYTDYWDTTTSADGPHTLSAKVYDVLGQSTASNSLNLAVSNLVLFQDNLANTLNAWTILDEGTVSAPSAWQIVGGVLTQTSSIYGDDPANSLTKPGTMLLTGTPTWTDYSFTSQMRAGNGSIGVIFRYQDNNNYYRWSMDPDGLSRIEQKFHGTMNLMSQYSQSYVPSQWYTVTVDVKSYLLRIFVNGQLAAQSNNSAVSNGGIGFYTWKTTDASFRNVRVLASVIPTLPPVITSAGTATGTIGVAFNYQIIATNNPASFNATGLPAGLAVNTGTGLISGTPTTAGTTNVTLSATNAGGTGTLNLSLTINPTPPPTAPVITSAGSATGTTGTAFSYQITATHNPTSYGAVGLPDGLSVDPVGGLISGTPTTPGVANVTLSATNASGTGTAPLALTLYSACDGNHDGIVDISDIQQEVNMAIGVSPCTVDINQDALCNVIDIQRIVVVILGGACVSP